MRELFMVFYILCCITVIFYIVIDVIYSVYEIMLKHSKSKVIAVVTSCITAVVIYNICNLIKMFVIWD